MGLETGTYISDLVVTNPTSSDPKSQGDDHFRLVKSTIKTTFPGVTGAVTPTHTELNYVDGVTSAIQTQLDLKSPLASPALTGTPTCPTADTGTSGTQIASLDYVIATSLSASLPGQTGNAGKLISTDGVDGFWEDEIDGSVVSLLGGGDLVGTTETQSLSNKSLTTPIVQDSADTTKKANFILSGVTAGQNRNITVEDENISLFTPGWRLLSVVTASSSTTVDIENVFTSAYDNYRIVFSGVKVSSSTASMSVRFKLAGSYVSTATYNYITDGNSALTGQTSILVVEGGTHTDGNINGEINVSNPSVTTQKHSIYANGYSAGAIQTALGKGGHNTGTGNALTGIRFFLTSGNYVVGDFRTYGLRNT